MRSTRSTARSPCVAAACCRPRAGTSAPAPTWVNRWEEAAGGLGAVNPLYDQAVRLFSAKKPVVAAVQGAAVGAGLGLAVMADFRIASPDARFVANFVKLGFHPGFGLTHTLPRLIGRTKAELMCLTGRRVKAEEGLPRGLVRTRWSRWMDLRAAAPAARQARSRRRTRPWPSSRPARPCAATSPPPSAPRSGHRSRRTVAGCATPRTTKVGLSARSPSGGPGCS